MARISVVFDTLAASHAGVVALRRRAGERAQPVAGAGDDLIAGVLYDAHRRQAVEPGQARPRPRQFSQGTVDRRCAALLPAVRVDRPGGAPRILLRQPVPFGQPRGLGGERQHTAGRVAPAQPARPPGSKASGAVEQDDQAILPHQSSPPKSSPPKLSSPSSMPSPELKSSSPPSKPTSSDRTVAKVETSLRRLRFPQCGHGGSGADPMGSSALERLRQAVHPYS